MLRSLLSISCIIVLASFAGLPSDEKGVYSHPAFVGKKIQSTVFGEYFKDGLKGKTIAMVVSYGCEHCQDATRDAQKLWDEKLIDNIVILGTEMGDTGSRDKFKKAVEHNYTMIEYDFTQLAPKLMAVDSLFPPVPVGIYLKDDVIVKMYTQIPGVNSFAKFNK